MTSQNCNVSVNFSQFSLTFANGLNGDPAVFGYLPRIGKGWLFDLGVIDNLSNKDLLRVSHAAISHTHIDHFIGFDRLVRVNIPHFRQLTLVGPKGLATNVAAKLSGYTWNLLQPDQLRFKVHEIVRSGVSETYSLSNSDGFALHHEGQSPLPLDIGHGMTLTGVPLQHGNIPSIGYKLQLEPKIKVAGDKLSADGIERGPWIQELQAKASAAFRTAATHKPPQAWQDELLAGLPAKLCISGQGSDEITIATKKLLDEYFSFPTPESIGYITDIGFTEENLSAAKAGLAPVTHVVCEASFLERDLERAQQKAHLTTKQAAQIAVALGGQSLTTFHYSNIYGGQYEEHQNEARQFFAEAKPSETLE